MTQEGVIKGLECCFDALVQEEHAFAENGVVMSSWQDRAKRIDAVREAIAFLKAQEPRVMTLEEYKALAEKPKEERDPVWEEWPGLESTWAIPNQAYGGYGTSWRCWTSRPTDEQREAEPWRS